MEDFLSPIRRSALAMLDAGRKFDGGIFQVLSANNLLSEAVLNKSFDRSILVSDVKSTFLSGGTLAALILTIIFVIIFLSFVTVSIITRFKSSSQRYQFGQKLRVRVKSLEDQLPVPLRGVFGLVCVMLLLLAMLPLIFAFAANSKLHSAVAEANEDREGSIIHQLSMTFRHVDNFLKDLVPQARIDVAPVINRTLTSTMKMKSESQKAYQDAFQEEIGANLLKSSSNDLLMRLRFFYELGKEVKETFGSLKDVEKLDRTIDALDGNCNNASKCYEHFKLVNDSRMAIISFKAHWNQTGIINETSAMKTFLENMPSVLDASGSTPDVQDMKKQKKLQVSREFNRNITSVFDKELNSTAFVIGSLNAKLDELEEKIDSGREALTNASVKAKANFSAAAPKYESIRFAITIVLLFLLLLILVWLSTTISVVLFLPSTANRKQDCMVSSVYISYILHAIIICLVFCLFAVTSMLETEICRYLVEDQPATGRSTIDRFIVPELNTVIAEMKNRYRSDPNKTDVIPLKGLDRLFGGIQSGCQRNQPILVALNSVGLIDTSVGDSSAASLKFKEKGRDILRREMNKANLSVLLDKRMESDMNSLKIVLDKYGETDFTTLAHELINHEKSVETLIEELQKLLALNKYIWDNEIYSSSLALIILQNNDRNINLMLKSLVNAKTFISSFSSKLLKMEKQKHIMAVVEDILKGNRRMKVYLTNQALWTNTAVKYYTEYVINGSTEESNKIAENTTVEFLSSIGKCRQIYDFYQASIGIPCRTLLYPLSILWFTLGWCVFAGTVFSLFAHISIVCFTGPRPSNVDEVLPSKFRTNDGQISMETNSKRGDVSENLLADNAQTVI